MSHACSPEKVAVSISRGNTGQAKKKKKQSEVRITEAELTAQDQVYLDNNRSRALVGQSRNVNKKDHHEHPLVINVCYT